VAEESGRLLFFFFFFFLHVPLGSPFRFTQNKRVWLKAFSKHRVDFGTLVRQCQEIDCDRDGKRIGIFFSIQLDEILKKHDLTPVPKIALILESHH
jgi:hypothetical protein